MLESSGKPILDQTAQHIIHLIAPCAPFSDDLTDIDWLEVIRIWCPERGDRLSSKWRRRSWLSRIRDRTLAAMKQGSLTYLKHHFPIAMPHMADPGSTQTVTYPVEHNEQGIMGLVTNRPSGLNLAEVFEQLKSDALPPAHCRRVDIYNGSPVQTDRDFVLHPDDLGYRLALELGELVMSTSKGVLFTIAADANPERSLTSLSYAGWEAGQSETELNNSA